MRVAPKELRQALLIARDTGQRQGDLLKLTWDDYRDGHFHLRQNKGKSRIQLPATAVVAKMLASMDRSKATILTTKSGLPWKRDHFKSQWRKASLAAGVVDLHFHDLRGTTVLRLAQAGSTIPEIASVTGHNLKSVHQILEKYLPRNAALAGAAVKRLEASQDLEHTQRLYSLMMGEQVKHRNP